MAHSITRLEGGELGGILSINGDVVTGTGITVQTLIKRTGDYGIRIVNDGVAASHLQLAISFAADGGTVTTPFAACSYRFYLFNVAYPSASAVVWGLGTNHVVSMSTAGVLTIDGTVGSTVLSLFTWYKIDCIYDSASTGSVTLRIDDDVEVSGVTPTSNGTVGTIRFGKTLSPGSYNFVVDDIVIEAAAAVASLDYPEPGGILALDPDANGALASVWGVYPTGTPLARWELVQRPDNGDVNGIQLSGSGSRHQTFTLEDPDDVGINSIINCVMFTDTDKRTNANNVNVRLLAGAQNYSTRAAGFVTSVTTSDITGTAYTLHGSTHQVSPFTSLPWVLTELDTMVVGIFATLSASAFFKESTISVMVDSQAPVAEPGTGVNSTYLTQIQMLTGGLASYVAYSPHIQTIQITSETFGEANKAFNIVACSIRYVPNGNELIRGSWFFDKNATAGFNLDVNPLERSLIDTEDDSTFTFGSSTLLDNREVYAQFVQLGGSGKFFQMDFVQTGPRKMDILALEFEVKIEGRREAYLHGNY